MSVEVRKLNKLVIVGGGTAGWMTAARLARHFGRTSVQLILVESSEIGTVGVGEATIPTLRRFYADLGISDAEVIRVTGATCKLGIQFENWQQAGSRFIHPFGLFGQRANGIDFHHYWLRASTLGDAGELPEYSLGVQLAEHHRFVEPSPNPPSELSVFDWALHFDATRFAQLMRDSAERHGVRRVDAKVQRVNLHPDTGYIRSLSLDNGEHLEGDVFIDCSGFRALLIEEALQVGYEDWSQWLPCDRAVAVQSRREGAPPPYTVSLAHRAGWQWRIPLQHRQGNGHVYCSQYCSDEDAEATLRQHIDGELLHEPRRFAFTAGRRRRVWHRNCIAVGLASGFLEPLESTSIALVETAIEKIRHAFQRPGYTDAQVSEFNDLTAQEYERVRDFIILHYKLNQRHGEAFWDRCREMVVPDSLRQKIQAFRERGELIRYPVEIFGPPSWLAIYNGFGCLPESYHPDAERLEADYLLSSLKQMRQSVAQTVKAVPSHEEFLAGCEMSDVSRLTSDV